MAQYEQAESYFNDFWMKYADAYRNFTMVINIEFVSSALFALFTYNYTSETTQHLAQGQTRMACSAIRDLDGTNNKRSDYEKKNEKINPVTMSTPGAVLGATFIAEGAHNKEFRKKAFKYLYYAAKDVVAGTFDLIWCVCSASNDYINYDESQDENEILGDLVIPAPE